VKAKRHALAQRREIQGHSQETLARALGVELTTVGRWERGETSPQPWSRPKLADALAISLEELDHLLAEGQPAKAVVTSMRLTSRVTIRCSRHRGATEVPLRWQSC
jgi:transcriptional regulator with XRE-family HTH domain